MKTFLIDAIHCLVDKETGLKKDMYDLLETYDNKKIILTGANDEQMEKFGLHTMPYEVFTCKHDPEKTDPRYYEIFLETYGYSVRDVIYVEHGSDAIASAQQHNIVCHHYDPDKHDLAAMKVFLDTHKNI